MTPKCVCVAQEDELVVAHRDLSAASRKLDDLCKQLIKQEESHKQVCKGCSIACFITVCVCFYVCVRV